MANSGSNKFPISKNIIYDSGNDTSTGRKRAVELGGGVSVAERARLFGAQVTHTSAAKNSKPQRPPINNQRPPINNQQPPINNRRPSINNQSPPIDNQPSPVNNQPPKSNIIHQDRNYQPYKTDIYRNPKYDTAYVPPQIVPNYSRPPVVQFNDKQSRNYATVTRPQNYQQQSSTRQQPLPNYDIFQRSTSEKPMPKKTYPTQIIPGESYISDRNPHFDSYERQKPVSPLRNLNYFQPIQDPLEVLYKSSSQGYYQQQQQQQIPTSINTNISGIQPFDLGNLIGRIQEDYLNNIRPYVSSVEFIESELNLANVGLITPSTTRKDYMRRSDDIYNQQGTKYYDVIDPNNSLYPAYSRQLYNDNNNYSSMSRRKHRRRYHDQASSPIHMTQSSDKNNQQYKPESPKASTPIAESESEEEETIATNTQADASKTTEPETSSESEEESSEHPITTPAIQHNETIRPPLPVQPPPTAAVRTPAKSSESESSESEESNSDSESETEDDEDEKPKPSPATQSNNLRTAPATPQANTRGTPQTNTRGTPQINTRGTPQTNTRGTPQANIRGTPQINIRGTPQINARDAPQPTSIDTSSRNQPPEYSSSVNTFDIQNSGKSSGGVGRFKSITNKFRRKKS